MLSFEAILTESSAETSKVKVRNFFISINAMKQMGGSLVKRKTGVIALPLMNYHETSIAKKCNVKIISK